MKHQLDFERPIAELQSKLEELKKHPEMHALDISLAEEVAVMEKKIEETKRQIFSNLSAWDRIKIARHAKRPFTMDYLELAFTDFTELHGDRLFAEDRAIVGGFARLGGYRVMVMGTQKGRDTKENILRNFGSAHPEGYRKALRLMRIADKFGLPIVSFIDTPGAYPGIDAEARGQAEAIARSIEACLQLTVPMIATIIGEGGSGGALALGAGNKVLMMEHAIYSVISPEACASIIWRTAENAQDAAEALKLTAQDLMKLGIIDAIIPEPLGGAHRLPEPAIAAVGDAIETVLRPLAALDGATLRKERREKFLAMGHRGL